MSEKSDQDVKKAALMAARKTYGSPKKDVSALSDGELSMRCALWVARSSNNGIRDWTLSSPVYRNEDPDLLFSELITRFFNLKQHPKEERISFWEGKAATLEAKIAAIKRVFEQ